MPKSGTVGQLDSRFLGVRLNQNALYPVASGWLRYAIPIAATAACTLLRFALDPWLGDASQLTLYFLGIMMSAAAGGLGPGLLATALSLFVGHFCFFPPRFVFAVMELWTEPLQLATGATVGCSMSLICEALHRGRLHVHRAQQVLRESSELAAAKASAEQANAAKDHFLAVLSHELRNPLTPVLPALSALAKLMPDTGHDLVEIVRRNVELEVRLIDDLLDVTRIARSKIELDRKRVQLDTIVHAAADVCRADIDARQLRFDIQIDEAPHTVLADPARLQQVFWNLFKNAVKFTPAGGAVSVRCWRLGNRVLASVSDTGEGIVPDALARIFNAFEQESQATTRQFGGLGLGLAISKTIMELHGGTIVACSAGKGRGATFTISLPLAEPASIDNPAVPLPGAGPALKPRKLKILLVEDHGDTALVIGRLLRAEGHTVQHAGDVTTALQIAASSRFDVLVSDLGLPDGTGHDLMQQLVARDLWLPAIAVSGYGMAEDVERSRDAGFIDHLTKPVDFPNLLATVTRVATTRDSRTPASTR